MFRGLYEPGNEKAEKARFYITTGTSVYLDNVSIIPMPDRPLTEILKEQVLASRMEKERDKWSKMVSGTPKLKEKHEEKLAGIYRRFDTVKNLVSGETEIPPEKEYEAEGNFAALQEEFEKLVHEIELDALL